MKSFSESLEGLKLSLQSQHPSMSVERNPVLTSAKNDSFSANELESVLGQYSLLPARIVEFLSTGATRLEEWKDVKEELERNIQEERGSRTEQLSHYRILKTALLRELNLDVAGVRPSASTGRFLGLMRTGLARQPKAFVAGVLYGLEASAVPELTIVAKLINEYADSMGLRPPINEGDLAEHPLKGEESDAATDTYSLSVFFSTHLWDFEVGHRAGLEISIPKHLKASDDIKRFELGFEYVLDAMDEWWRALAEGAAFKESNFAMREEEQRYVFANS